GAGGRAGARRPGGPAQPSRAARRTGRRSRAVRRGAVRVGGGAGGPVGCAPAMSAPEGRRTLSEHDSKQLLAGYGVPVARERLAADPAEARRAAEELGFPVALKLCGEAIAHKTERDLVRLGLADPAAVERAAAELWA